MSFWCLHFLPKKTKTSWQVVKSNLFVHFLEEISACKNHFEFVWPLGFKPKLIQIFPPGMCALHETYWHEIFRWLKKKTRNLNKMTLRSSVRCCKCPLKHHFKTQCPIQSELRAIYHENKHEDHGCTSDDTVVIVSSCAQCALAKLHNAAFWQKNRPMKICLFFKI